MATGIVESETLIVSADVGDGATVTFDRYSRESEYGQYDKVLANILDA